MNHSVEDSKNFLIEWNEKFPLDYWWRKKYNIPFNSIKHRNISYIDIFYEWLEQKMFDEFLENKNNTEKEIEQQKEKEQHKLEDLFDKMSIADFNVSNEEEE